MGVKGSCASDDQAIMTGDTAESVMGVKGSCASYDQALMTGDTAALGALAVLGSLPSARTHKGAAQRIFTSRSRAVRSSIACTLARRQFWWLPVTPSVCLSGSPPSGRCWTAAATAEGPRRRRVRRPWRRCSQVVCAAPTARAQTRCSPAHGRQRRQRSLPTATAAAAALPAARLGQQVAAAAGVGVRSAAARRSALVPQRRSLLRGSFGAAARTWEAAGGCSPPGACPAWAARAARSAAPASSCCMAMAHKKGLRRRDGGRCHWPPMAAAAAVTLVAEWLSQ